MLPSYYKKFTLLNKKIWKNNLKYSKDFFLVEGLLGSMPTHLIRLGITLNAIKDTTNKKPLVILKNRIDNMNERELFESFGVTEFVYIDDIRLNILEIAYVIIKKIKCTKFKGVDSILSMEYNKINIGHLIYDDVIHSDLGRYTIKKVDRKCISTLYKALIYILKYSKIIDDYETELVVITHNEYVDYGTLGVAAIAKHKTIVNINDRELSINNNKDGLYATERISIGLRKIISDADKCSLEKKGRNLLQKRVCAEVGLHDTKNAFLNKKLYTRKELAEKFSHNKKKNIFIFMHAFSDAPHLSKMTMYRDYYEWIFDTLRQISNIDSVNWYIKPHPSAFIFGETNEIDRMKKENQKNVFWLPDDFNTLSIKDTADAIVTCQGTVGIEASCMGIPVVITGLPYYSRFGFTIEPKTKREYYSLLNKLYKVRKLSVEKTRKAQAVLGAYSEYIFTDNTILDSEVYEYAGYGKRTDYGRAYNKIISNMQGKICNDIPLYNKTKELLNQYLKQK